MRLGALAAVSFLAILGAEAQAAPAPRDFAVADHPLTDDVPLARPRVFPNGVTALEDVRYAAISGWRRLTMDIYMPPKKSGPKPLVVYIHGGGWMNGDSRHFGSLADFPAVASKLASEGFVVAAIEYRHGAEAKYPAQVQDARAAIRFLKSNAAKYGIDPSRVGLIGGSAGAHIASLTAFSCGDASLEAAGTKADAGSECVQAFVGWYGVYDVPALNASRPGGNDGAIGKLLGCEGPCTVDQLNSVSPVHYLDAKDPPVLLVHGTEDKTVPVSQSHILEGKLKALGIPVSATYIPGVDHSFIGKTPAETRAATLKAVNLSFDFLHATLDKKAAK